MKQKRQRFHFVGALIMFIVMFGIANLVETSALSAGPVSRQSIETCVSRIFEIDRDPIYGDVGSQEWYSHAANFLVLLNEARAASGSEEDESPSKPNFYPSQNITRGDFLDMVKDYKVLFPKADRIASQYSGKKTDAKLTIREAAQIVSKLTGIRFQEILKELKKNKVRLWVKRSSAASILLRAATMKLSKSPEEELCLAHAVEDPENFEETFGTPAQPPAPEGGDASVVPDESGTTTATNPPGSASGQTPDPTSTELEIVRADLSFTPANPRAGESVKVKVLGFDAENKPAANKSLRLGLSAGLDFEKFYDLKGNGQGGYETDVSLTWAGTYNVTVLEKTKSIGETKSLTVAPDDPETMKLDISKSQAETDSKKEAVVSATLRDKFGNVIDSNPRDYRITTDMGTIKKTEKIDQEILITIEGNAWGQATVDVSHLTRAVQDASGKIKVPFSPVVLGLPKGIEVGESISIPAYIFLPPSEGKIAGYRVKLNYEKEDFVFKNVTDLDPSDGFDTPKVAAGNDGSLLLEQTTKTLPQEGVVPIGMINVLATTVATSGTIMVGEGVVINQDEKIISMDPSSDFMETLVRWWYSIKAVKDVCVDIWLAEGSGANRSEALDDVQKASNMYLRAANASACPFYMNWDIHFHSISAADWAARVDAPGGTPNVLDNGEEANLRANFPATAAKCVQVWYVPDIAPLPSGLDPAGLSYPNNGGIAVDNHGDGIDHVLGHELNHQLSGNAVLDSPNDPANSQGALDPGNSMNYNNPGFGLTKTQCDLMKQKPYIP